MPNPISLSPAAEFWSHHIRQHRQSDLSVADYCRRHDLSSASFYYWRRKLELATPAEACPAFTELRLAPAASPTPITLEHPSGLRITLPENFSESTLRRLLDLLSC